MIAEAARRLLCRWGRHDVVRCAGAEDHRWTWRNNRWHAELVPPAPPLTPVLLRGPTAGIRHVPVGKLDPVTPGRGEPTTPGSEEPVVSDPDPVEVDPEPVTGAALERAFYGRADELIARGDVDGYLQLLRDADRVGSDQLVLTPSAPAGKNDHEAGRHRRG